MLTGNVWTLSDCSESQALGLELCGEASVPLPTGRNSPMLPFTGPITGSLVLKKKDTHTGYNMEIKYEREVCY